MYNIYTSKIVELIAYKNACLFPCRHKDRHYRYSLNGMHICNISTLCLCVLYPFTHHALIEPSAAVSCTCNNVCMHIIISTNAIFTHAVIYMFVGIHELHVLE